MGLKNAIEKLKLDSRMIEINFKSGLLTKEEYEKYLKSLQDSASQAAQIEIEDGKNGSASGSEFNQ